jgi:hypothetical protein
MDKDKTEVAWFFASERPRGPSIAKAKNWRLDWGGVTRKFDIKAKPVRWLGFFLDCRINWQAHVKHRLALGHHRIRTNHDGQRDQTEASTQGWVGGSNVDSCIRG